MVSASGQRRDNGLDGTSSFQESVSLALLSQRRPFPRYGENAPFREEQEDDGEQRERERSGLSGLGGEECGDEEGDDSGCEQ